MSDGGTGSLPKWGKAGVRLTEAEARARRGRRLAAKYRSNERVKQHEAMAKRRWAAGMVVPYNITTALDSLNLFGPEVDAACGVEEPAVDLWEQGKLYPTWEQLQALAVLTQKTAYLFTVAHERISFYDTSMRFHVDPRVYRPREPVLRYPDEVVRRCPGTNIDDPMNAGH